MSCDFRQSGHKSEGFGHFGEGGGVAVSEMGDWLFSKLLLLGAIELSQDHVDPLSPSQHAPLHRDAAVCSSQGGHDPYDFKLQGKRRSGQCPV